MLQKSSFQTVSMIKALVLKPGILIWIQGNWLLHVSAENFTIFVVWNWVLGLFNRFWVWKSKN